MPITPDDLGLVDVEKSITRIRFLAEKMRLASRKIASGKARDIESGERKMKAELRQKAMEALETEEEPLLTVTPGLGLEANIGERNNILSGEFLEIGILAARSICKITRGVETGTGFLVGDGVLLTNYHVIKTEEQAKQSLFEFLYDDNTIGTPRNSVAYFADPDRFFFADKALDLCFVSIGEADILPPISTFGWLPLIKDEGKILIGDPVNIIQHPLGQQKRVVVHESTFVLVEDVPDVEAFCWYTGDTEKGSSGSPVLNSRWEVVALHHQSVPATDKNGNVLDVNGKTIAASRTDHADTKIKWIANEGIRISRIVARLETAEIRESQDNLRRTLLELWSNPLATMLARQASLNGMEQN